MCNYSFFVGIDASKATIDVSCTMEQITYVGQFENSVSGFTVMIKQLAQRTSSATSEWFVCFENTGSYSKELLYWLTSQNIACREENPIEITRSIGLRRGKDDKVDSKVICNFAFEKRDKITPSILDKSFIVSLKKVLSRRDLLVKQRAALKTSLAEQKYVPDEALQEKLEQQNEELIASYDKIIKELEQEIQQIIQTDQQAKTNNTLLQSITGIATITAAYLISSTNNFQSFSNARKFACYCGVAPFPNQSGTKAGRMKVSHMANKKLKSILSSGIISAIAHDPEIGQYYQRKINEGKHKGVVLNAIKNKMIQRAFDVIKRQSPYVKLHSYAQ